MQSVRARGGANDVATKTLCGCQRNTLLANEQICVKIIFFLCSCNCVHSIPLSSVAGELDIVTQNVVFFSSPFSTANIRRELAGPNLASIRINLAIKANAPSPAHMHALAVRFSYPRRCRKCSTDFLQVLRRATPRSAASRCEITPNERY